MGVATAAVVAGTAVSAYGAYSAGQAASGAAADQKQASDAWLSYTKNQRAAAAQAYDQYSPAQASNIEKSLASQEYNVSRQEALVRNIDPSLIEAGKQMKQLLDGQSAPVLDNIKNQRQLQRTNLLDTLRQQYGPGAETSQAGINALQKFDAETANSLSNAQQDYLGKVSNIALSGSSSLGASLGEVNKTLAGLADDYGNIGLNKANILAGNATSAAAPYQSQVQTAGNSGVQGTLQGQMFSGIGQGIAQAGGAYAATQRNLTLQDSVTPTPSTGAGTYRSPSASNGYANSFGGDSLSARLGTG